MRRIFILLLFIFLAGCANRNIKMVCIKNVCIQAQIADSRQEQERGLMFRKSLADNQGMLFIFDKEAKYGFWTKNMQFPLDIIWISQDKRIVDIKTNVLPCQEPCEILMPNAYARYVLEVNAGFVERNQIKIGEKVNF